MSARKEKRPFPGEELWIFFLVLGFLGALTIESKSFILKYHGRISGQHAMAIGYLLSGVASVGLFNYYWAFEKEIPKIRNLSRLFWAVYALCMALPFVIDRLSLSRLIEGSLLAASAMLIALLGHIYYSKVKSISKTNSASF